MRIFIDPKYKIMKPSVSWRLAALFGIVLTAGRTYGQTADGNAGITQATQMITGYFAGLSTLMYAIGAVVGLVGAIRVFIKWNHGDHNTGKIAFAWFGSCIFLVVVATVIKSFFGL